MSRITIPQSKRWSGIFPGEYFGNIFACGSIDLERSKGQIIPAETYTSIFDSDDDADLTTPVAFVRTGADGTDRYWALGGKLFKTTNTNPENGWTQDAIASSPTAPLYDMVEFIDALLVAIDTNISRLSSGTWTGNWWSSLSGAAALQTGVPHRFHIFSGAVLITDGRFINDYDGTLARDPALTLPTDFEAQWINSTADFAYIGTKKLTGGDAEVFFWDRVSATFNSRYEVGDTECLAGFTARGIPYIITKKGAIKRFSGQGFSTVQQFPTVELGKNITDINPNGIVVEENSVKIIVNFGALTDQRLVSGIWVYELDSGNLYHGGSVVNGVSKDAAQLELSAVGAMKKTALTQGRYLIGAKPYKVYTGTTLDGIFTSDESSTTGQYAYFMTPKIPASDVRRFFRRLFARFERFIDSTYRIRIAYRLRNDLNLPAYSTITWASTTTFTTTDANVAAGDFVLVLAGDNAGKIVKVSSVAAGSPNTVTIDTALSSSTNAARAVFLRFTDLATISSQAAQKGVFNISRRSEFIQFFIIIKGSETSPALNDLILDYKEISI